MVLLSALLVEVAEFVVQAVLAADERRAECHRHVVAGQRGAHERPQCLGPIGVSPAEVVENGHALWIGTDGHAVADRFVDGTGRHVVRIEISVARIHPAGEHQATVRTRATGATPRRHWDRHSSTPTSGFTTLPPCTS